MSDPLVEAQDPTAHPRRLSVLSHDPDGAVREAVAKNPNTPIPDLMRLGAEFPLAFLRNPALPLLLLEDPALYRRMPEATARALLDAEALPVDVLEQFMKHRSWAVRRAVAANPGTPGEMVETLSRQYYYFEEAAQHPNTPADYVAFLATHPWASIRTLVALRDALATDVMGTLVKDEDPKVLDALAQREDLPVEVAATLSEQGFVRREVVMQLRRNRRRSTAPDDSDLGS